MTGDVVSRSISIPFSIFSSLQLLLSPLHFTSPFSSSPLLLFLLRAYSRIFILDNPALALRIQETATTPRALAPLPEAALLLRRVRLRVFPSGGAADAEKYGGEDEAGEGGPHEAERFFTQACGLAVALEVLLAFDVGGTDRDC